MGARSAAKAAAAAGNEAAAAGGEELLALPALPPRRKGGTAKWKKGSRVLVPHTDQYYAAVVMAGQKRPDGQWYLLHYEGWSNKYDEWVEEAGVVRFDKALLEQSAAAAGNAPGDLSGRKRKADIAPAEPALAVEIPQQLRLHIPPLLKKVVLDDSEQVNLKGALLPLPRSSHGRPTVNDILREYEEAVAKEAPQEGEQQDHAQAAAEVARELAAWVRGYFDQALRPFLLYSHEVAQADEALLATPPGASGRKGGKGGGKGGKGGKGDGAAADASKDGDAGASKGQSKGQQPQSGSGGRRAPSDLYGAEHLVRLFVKLPELVPVAYMTPPDVVRLEQQLHDLMGRMTQVKRQAKLFSLAVEYKPNPHYNPLLSLHLQPLLATGALTAGGAGATPAAAAAGTPAGGTPAPGTGGGTGSEAGDMGQGGSPG